MEYRGWTIEKETDPWPLKYGWEYRYFIDEHLHGAKTIEEAKEEIDERIAELETKYNNEN